MQDHQPDTNPDDGPLARRYDDRGAGLVEYALLVALIVLTCVGAMTYFSEATEEKFTDSCEAIGNAMTGSSNCS
ncbi:MAG: Flp family type IVb pilin [Acidimicrobiia bacterium]|nr:Flp family type IVb pilin [Acidimicrobiia bacterium]